MVVTDKKLHADVVCTGCGLLCDDIFVEMEGGKMLKCINACKRGRDKLQYYINEPEALLLQHRPNKTGSETITYEKAIIEAVKVLKVAKRPLFYGFASCSLEDQAAMSDLASKVSAHVTSPALRCLSPLYSAASTRNYYAGTLGEAINKADVFVFWNADPIESHPRLLSKLIYTRGFFRITGYEVKKYVVVAPEKIEHFRGTTLAIQVPPDAELSVLDGLKATLTGQAPASLPPDVNQKDFDTLATLLKHGEYVILFLDKRLLLSKDFQGTVERLLDVLDLINQKQRAMVLPLPEDMNSMGMFQHTTFTGKFPPADIDWTKVDALLVGGVESTSEIPTELLDVAKRVPTIFLPQEEMMLGRSADVVIPVVAPGISSEGTAMRLDGVSLPLKQLIARKGNTPTLARVMQDLINHL